MQPFTPLLLSWFGKSELKTLHAAEWQGGLMAPQGRALMCGFYLNELMLRLLARGDAHEMLYDRFIATLEQLAGEACNTDYERILRRFEKNLLSEIGYGATFDVDADNGAPIESHARYVFQPERGRAACIWPAGLSGIGPDADRSGADQFERQVTLTEAKALMRTLINHYAGRQAALYSPAIARPYRIKPMSIFLGVNIDHVATLRQARKTRYPSPVEAALMAETAGADSITLHLREDRRHIQDADVAILRQVLKTKMNLEMAVTDEMLGIACATQPQDVCLVPEKREELTTEGGLDVAGQQAKIQAACTRLGGCWYPGVAVHRCRYGATRCRTCSRRTRGRNPHRCVRRCPHRCRAHGGIRAHPQGRGLWSQHRSYRECRAWPDLSQRTADCSAAGHP